MYTSPAFARRGIGRLILSLCEAAAAAEGFRRLELMATLSGEPLYTAYGFRPLEHVADATDGSGARGAVHPDGEAGRPGVARLTTGAAAARRTGR